MENFTFLSCSKRIHARSALATRKKKWNLREKSCLNDSRYIKPSTYFIIQSPQRNELRLEYPAYKSHPVLRSNSWIKRVSFIPWKKSLFHFTLEFFSRPLNRNWNIKPAASVSFFTLSSFSWILNTCGQLYDHGKLTTHHTQWSYKYPYK